MSNIQKVASQLGLELLPENVTHENRMHVKSQSSNRLYVVSQAKSSGEWQCSCPAWVMKKPGKPRGCKHLKAILPALAGDDPKKLMRA